MARYRISAQKLTGCPGQARTKPRSKIQPSQNSVGDHRRTTAARRRQPPPCSVRCSAARLPQRVRRMVHDAPTNGASNGRTQQPPCANQSASMLRSRGQPATSGATPSRHARRLLRPLIASPCVRDAASGRPAIAQPLVKQQPRIGSRAQAIARLRARYRASMLAPPHAADAG
ncbi:villin-4-like [Dorcoceras hygrometricum]|uniref:Villin-4-like n=1 Tax=Dorcoceras hygrometricum TaxID=472368 RepID=A0A2Z6ZTF9_9LAMI|nr:villin-4-like [Dorcoceras hygrometricum]